MVEPRSRQSQSVRDVYAAHADFVRQVVLRLGGPTGDHEDLTHEVFLVVLRRKDELARLREPRAWLYAVAAKVVTAARRRQRLRRTFGLTDREASAEVSPLEAFEQKEACALVYRALEGLSEKKRTVFILYELEELSGEDIAAVVGAPLKTVWSRLAQGRREFSRELQRLRAADALVDARLSAGGVGR